MLRCRKRRGAMSGMSPHDFVRKRQPGAPAHGLSERAGAQVHFIDLCRVLGVPEPGEPERYCFERARAAMAAGRLQRAGLVVTNSIGDGANRDVLDAIVKRTRIFEPWSDVEWVNDGAAVRDLTSGVNLTEARKLSEAVNCSFVATVKAGSFDIPGAVARAGLALPNLLGVSNAKVVKRRANGIDMTRLWTDTWVIDFGVDVSP